LAWANIISSTSEGSRPSAEALHQVVELVVGQRQAERGVGLLQRRATAGQHRHRGQRARRVLLEQSLGLLQRAEHHLGHPIV
jgi:hypothetical protein